MGAKKGRLVYDITRHEDWERREDVEIEFFFSLMQAEFD